MIVVDRILGSRDEADYARRLHRMEHAGEVELLVLPQSELARRRFRALTENGSEIAVALPRDEALFDGAVLFLDDHRAVVVKVDAERWLRIRPQDMASAVEVGYHCGNLHWRVRFDGDAMLVALEGPTEAYLSRLTALGLDARVTATVDDVAAA